MQQCRKSLIASIIMLRIYIRHGDAKAFVAILVLNLMTLPDSSASAKYIKQYKEKI